jgi:hypothetical protein
MQMAQPIFATLARNHSGQTTNLTTICRAIAISLTHHAQEPIIGIHIVIVAHPIMGAR